MANIEDFLMENIGSPVKEEVVKFKRLKTPFKIKSLTAEDVTELRKQATRRVLNKKTHQYEQETDQNVFAESVLTSSVVFPSLDSEELQTSWGCIGKPEKVLEKMLTLGEYNALTQRVMDLSGIGEDNDVDLVEEVKN